MNHNLPPDVVPNPYPAGHARDDQYQGAILRCSTYRLPDGRNY